MGQKAIYFILIENFIKVDHEVDELVMDAIDTSMGESSQLIVYNDDVNTFDWVIDCLMEICSHTYVQSEQLSLLVHFKGKATVKTAEFNILSPMKDALIERGLSAVIESFAS